MTLMAIVAMSLAWTAVSCDETGFLDLLTAADCKNSMPCGIPAPRAMLLTDVVGLTNTTKTFPHMVVFHRCDGSGCCGEFNQSCGVELSEKIRIRYSIVGKTKYSFHHVDNHIRCSCK